MKKILVVGIIILFVGVSIAPSINSERIQIETLDNIESKIVNEKENDGESISGWQLYRYCYIFGDFFDDMFPNINWHGPFPIVKCSGYLYATLNGSKGKVEPSEIIGFGFRGIIYPYMLPRYWGHIDGYFRLCFYKE